MSTHIGGRTLARSQALQLLFQAEANSRAVLSVLDGDYVLWDAEPLDDYARRLALGADEMRPDLDAIISVRSTGWSLGRLNAVDRNLLRLALYEMLCVDDVDLAVTINECVELAKAYGTDESSRFVNGVLGRVSDDIEAGVDVIAAAREAARERSGAEGDAEAPAPDGSADDEAEQCRASTSRDTRPSGRSPSASMTSSPRCATRTCRSSARSTCSTRQSPSVRRR